MVGSDALGDELRAEAPTIERLARVQKLHVGSPGSPWAGRRRELRPRDSEIQRVYASRAAQIIHLLRRMPERKETDPGTGRGFTMIVNGQPTQILPSMFDWVETLPEHVVPVGWDGGELYVELPSGAKPRGVAPPPLSRDAFRLTARVAHRVRACPPGVPCSVIVVAPPALLAELSATSDLLAKYLGVTELRVVTSEGELPPREREYGRTAAGAPWSFYVVGASPSFRPPKHRAVRSRGSRLRPVFAPGELAPIVIDYATPDLIDREAAVRALSDELDEIVGVPLLGPAKLGSAWETGLRSVDAFRNASWSTLAELPGFGPDVATALVTKFGGAVPARPPRTLPRPRPPSETGPPQVGRVVTRPVLPVPALSLDPSVPPPVRPLVLPPPPGPPPPPTDVDPGPVAPSVDEPAIAPPGSASPEIPDDLPVAGPDRGDDPGPIEERAPPSPPAGKEAESALSAALSPTERSVSETIPRVDS
ncbi:MAG: helix-hairpin-helix domain-containing protein, partial [Thermoplasmata archaeon]